LAEEQTLYQGSPSTKILLPWTIVRGFVLSIVLGIAGAMLGGFFGFLAGVVVGFFLAYLWSAWLRSTYDYRVTTQGVHCFSGILFKQRKFLPFFKVTNTNVVQGPVDQVLGISNLQFQTAGAGGVSLPEIQFAGLEDPAQLEALVRKKVSESQ